MRKYSRALLINILLRTCCSSHMVTYLSFLLWEIVGFLEGLNQIFYEPWPREIIAVELESIKQLRKEGGNIRSKTHNFNWILSKMQGYSIWLKQCVLIVKACTLHLNHKAPSPQLKFFYFYLIFCPKRRSHLRRLSFFLTKTHFGSEYQFFSYFSCSKILTTSRSSWKRLISLSYLVMHLEIIPDKIGHLVLS